MERQLLRQDAAAQFLGLDERTLEAWRRRGIGPRWVKFTARAVRYRPDELERWVQEHVIVPGPHLRAKRAQGSKDRS